MSLPGFDDWLTDQDRYNGYPTEEDIIEWNEANQASAEEGEQDNG